MQTLTYGFKKPQVTDKGAIVFPALEANWQQVNDHNHDGVNSALISASNILPSQTGNAGKFLTTNGSILSWATVVGAGEVNTASNVGGGNGVFKQKSGVDLEFKTLVAGANVTITPVGDTLVFAASGGGGITAGMYAEYYSTAGYLGISPNTWYNMPFDTVVEDADGLYNPSNGVFKIPLSYVGTCRGVVRLYYFTNSAGGQNGYIKTALFKGGINGSGGVFQRYGNILSNYGISDALAEKCLYTEFKIVGVAGDEFYFSIYHNGVPQITGTINASRIEIDIYPK